VSPRSESVHIIEWPYGHDGLLIELDQVGALIADTLATS